MLEPCPDTGAQLVAETHHPSNVRKYPSCARLCWARKTQPGPRQAGWQERRGSARQAEGPPSQGSGHQHRTALLWELRHLPCTRDCQDLPPEGRGRRGLGYYQGTDPERKQEGGTSEMGSKESYRAGSTHRQSYLCTGGAGVDHEGGEKRHRSSLRPAGSRARQVPLQAFCGRPMRTCGVGSSHLSKGQFFFILAEVYKDISCARPM